MHRVEVGERRRREARVLAVVPQGMRGEADGRRRDVPRPQAREGAEVDEQQQQRGRPRDELVERGPRRRPSADARPAGLHVMAASQRRRGGCGGEEEEGCWRCY